MGRVLAECETSPDEVQYSELSVSAIRNARRNWMSQNHLYKLLHRGYTALAEAGDSEDGIAECPYEFYRIWATDVKKARQMSESVTRAAPEPPGD